MNVPSGWQYAMAANSASSRSRLSPTVRIDLAGGEHTGLTRLAAKVCGLGISPDGTTVVAGGWGGTVSAVETRTGQERWRLASLAWSPDARTVAIGNEGPSVNASASGDGRARARDADHYGCLARGTSSWTTSVTLRSLRAALCLRPPMPAVTSMSGTSNRASVASNYEAGRSRCWRLSSSTSATLPPPDGMSTAGRPSTSGTL